MRLAAINRQLCKPDKCRQECVDVCPINRTGKKCCWIDEQIKKARIDEELCIGCGLCVKRCPFKAIDVVNTPEKLKEAPVHRFGPNLFTLFRLPFPLKGEVVGLLGPNGTGKTSALKILSGDIVPNLGTDRPATPSALVKVFRGTELQEHLEQLTQKKLHSVVKPQNIEGLSKVEGTVAELLNRYNERGEMEKIIKELELEAVLERSLSELSGGELQRVAIAIASSRVADVYYFDEPSSYLDVRQRLAAAKLIRELATDSAVMAVEHDLATLDYLADRIHIFYGVPGAYGIVSKPYSCRVGINAFLDGYIKEDNVRFRPEAIDFKIVRTASTATMKPVLEWTELKKKFKGFELNISSGSLFAGEVLGIFGANALGKTTFAKMLAGELEPDSGTITKTLKISYKPQYITSDFKGTVAELLGTVVDVHSEEFRSDVLRPLELERIFEAQVSMLSGGELQRVAIALCLGRQAEIYLLDEPSAFLDSEQRLAVAKAIRKLAERKGCSVMVIDHDLLFLSYLADRAMLFTGISSVQGAAEQLDLAPAFNKFLMSLGITFRADPTTRRPRANKPGSQMDTEQKAAGKYFVL
ncbi:MAG: ribosome biogenesis/translation initiation ATPase RLI [Candidatus Aenigmatarchaeota archaeon]|nr:ribosome biogenesis/translation initiation ATPase RLI [Candidatus Aenigmarchaeota archaeon]